MPKISEVITSLIEIQQAIGDQEVELVGENEADIPLPDAPPLGINVLSNGHAKKKKKKPGLNINIPPFTHRDPPLNHK